MAITVANLVRSAPDDIELPEEALNQTVGWLSNEQRPVSLREFVAAQAPARVQASLHVKPWEAPKGRIKRVTELDDDELRHMVLSVLEEAPPEVVLSIVGDGSYDAAALARAVRRGTPIGRQVIEATSRHIELVEGLVEAGKIKGLTHEETTRDLKIDLDF